MQDQTFLSKILEDMNLKYDCIYFNDWNDFNYWGYDGKKPNALFQFDNNKIVIIRNLWTMHHQKLIGIFQK
jgi:hypothetical protein